MRLVVGCAALALVMAQGAKAQQADPVAAAPGTETPGAAEPGKGLIDADLEPAVGGYTYNPSARRDPFISLTKPVSADRSARQRPAGMEGFLIAEVALRGVVKTAGGGLNVGEKAGYVAVLQGTDKKSYFVREGQRLYDGVITAIDATSVTLRQEVSDPLSPVRTRDVKKSLYASEEARR
jgi:hypothetical protein